jgi:hypothetical protein
MTLATSSGPGSCLGSQMYHTHACDILAAPSAVQHFITAIQQVWILTKT